MVPLGVYPLASATLMSQEPAAAAAFKVQVISVVDAVTVPQTELATDTETPEVGRLVPVTVTEVPETV